jgi:transposase
MAKTCCISAATVERWYQSFVVGRVKELQSRLCPKALGIDEHFFTRKQGYATTLVSLDRHHVHDVVLGRSALAIAPALEKIREKHRCRVAVMDLSETYRSIVKEHFPNAQIVADRFHVVKLINHHFLKAWQQMDPAGRKNRGLMSLMRRHEWNMGIEQHERLRSYLKRNPMLESIYDFKQKLMKLVLLKKLRKADARPRLHELMQLLHELAHAPIDALKTLGETLLKWVEEIGRMWRFSKSNGITEGFHTKMEMLSRRAFGFRKFSNYRLRVLALCGWSGVSNRVDSIRG